MASMQGYDGYGGATITRVVDGAGAEWIGMCAKHNDVFAFYVFKNGQNVPINPMCSGRGTISRDGTWIAWEGNQHFKGELPGFVPLPSGGPPGPQGPAGPQGSGAITLLSAPVTSAEWDGRTLQGGAHVDIPSAFGVPSHSAYLVRFCAKAGAADVRVRAGTEAAPYFLTLNTQAPNIEIHTQGWIGGPGAYISTVGGSATIWLQVEGFG